MTPLGFKIKQRFSKPILEGYIEVAFIEMVGAVLELYQLPDSTAFDIRRCGIDHIAFTVSNLDTLMAALEQFGYSLHEGPITEGQLRYILICGPDGERLEFDEFIPER